MYLSILIPREHLLSDKILLIKFYTYKLIYFYLLLFTTDASYILTFILEPKAGYIIKIIINNRK